MIIPPAAISSVYESLSPNLKIFLSIATGGVIVEHDENDRLIAKPYNVNEVNK